MAEKEILNSDDVEKIFLDCLHKDGEEIKDYVKAEGIMSTVGFHPERLKSHEKEIMDMLLELPEPFLKSKGGGWSFLNACCDKHDNLWTGEHRRVEQLIQLGLAIGKVLCPMPRNVWPAMPGGMPYYTVNDEN